MRRIGLGFISVLLVFMLLAGAAQAQERLIVYSDFGNPDNHFFHKAAFFSEGGLAYLPVMDEKWKENVHSGSTAIQCQFEVRVNNWGGWYFQNGILQEGAKALAANWGTFPDAGLKLSEYSKLSFWARGEKGGEKVEFFCLGIGRDSQGVKTEDYPDSCPKMTTDKIVTALKTEWTQYTVDLRGCDLSYVLGGFGWASSALNNAGESSITFYLDDIAYEK